ncbi:MAG: hypothetical protein AAB521_03805 [Patescibacteria group bacterium]
MVKELDDRAFGCERPHCAKKFEDRTNAEAHEVSDGEHIIFLVTGLINKPAEFATALLTAEGPEILSIGSNYNIAHGQWFASKLLHTATERVKRLESINTEVNYRTLYEEAAIEMQK